MDPAILREQCSVPTQRTRDPDEAVHACTSGYYPHRLTLIGNTAGFEHTQCLTPFGPLTIGDITYATDVRLDFAEPRSGYHVDIPITGALFSRQHGTESTATPERATVFRPDAATTVTRWPGGSRHLAVKLDQTAVDRALTQLLGTAPDHPIPFAPALPLTRGPGRDWAQLLILLYRQLNQPRALIHHDIVAAPMAESVIHGLLLAADHPLREALARPAPSARPAAVQEAIDIIEAEAHLPLTVAHLAVRTHVSVRTLQEGFRRHIGMTPMACLRATRLRRAHRDLTAADPHVHTVAAIAHRWAFPNLGRFAAAYRAEFGRLPSDTLYDRPRP